MAYTIKKETPKTFDFQLEGSKKVYSVPVFRSLPLDMVLRANELKDDPEDIEALVFIKEIFDKYAPGVVDDLSTEQFAFLFRAYTEAEGNDASLGE